MLKVRFSCLELLDQPVYEWWCRKNAVLLCGREPVQIDTLEQEG